MEPPEDVLGAPRHRGSRSGSAKPRVSSPESLAADSARVAMLKPPSSARRHHGKPGRGRDQRHHPCAERRHAPGSGQAARDHGLEAQAGQRPAHTSRIRTGRRLEAAGVVSPARAAGPLELSAGQLVLGLGPPHHASRRHVVRELAFVHERPDPRVAAHGQALRAPVRPCPPPGARSRGARGTRGWACGRCRSRCGRRRRSPPPCRGCAWSTAASRRTSVSFMTMLSRTTAPARHRHAREQHRAHARSPAMRQPFAIRLRSDACRPLRSAPAAGRRSACGPPTGRRSGRAARCPRARSRLVW